MKDDNDIDFEKISEEALKRHASALHRITLDDTEPQHLSRSVINRANDVVKKQLFGSLHTINERINFIDLFLKSALEVFTPEEVYGILTHGSRYFKEGRTRDFDFILILKELKEKDLDGIMHIKNKFMEKGIEGLDLTLVYKDKLDI